MLEMFVNLPMKKTPPLRRVRSCDIAGQCRTCLDFFTVSIVLIGGIATLANTARMRWQSDPQTKKLRLIHRPNSCNGEIALYGTIEGLAPTTSHYVFPPTAATANARRALDANRDQSVPANRRSC